MTAYLDLAPVTVALRERPEEFRDLSGRLHHLPSRHTFAFGQDGSVRILADCDCSFLPTRPEDGELLRRTYNEWHMSFWRPFAINRAFAAHFRKPNLWRRLCVRLLIHLLEHQETSTPEHWYVGRSAAELS
jgi:hypothetical protein